MKKLILLCIILHYVFISKVLFAQTACESSFKEYYLNSNNIRASFFPGGSKFTTGEVGGFLVPYPSSGRVSTIFSSTPWVGGFDDAGNLKLSAETYPGLGQTDLFVGPLSSIGVPDTFFCNHFDKIWSVYREEILAHKADASDGIIHDTISSIFGWPAQGNQFFAQFNGFELPADHSGRWAWFFDENENGIYEPDLGDYPGVLFGGVQYIPDQIMWTVFNDAGVHSTGSTPLRFEFQLTAFAFHCTDSKLLNNTIFNSYKIINRATTALDSTFFGMWTDYDLGCSADDFIGSDSARNTEFVYNADPIDGDAFADCSSGADTYADYPPVQSMTYLSQPMHSFIAYTTTPTIPTELYNLLNGVWPDRTPIVPEGDGSVPGSTLSPTKFLFNGDPRDTSSWAAINVLDVGKDYRTVSSVFLGRLDPGQISTVELAYTFHLDSTLGHLDQITKMHENIDGLSASIDDLDENCNAFPLCYGEDCVWPGDFNHNGIADHYDLLYWGVMKGQVGPSRDGLVSWRGHVAENWLEETPDGINYKHGDADGSAVINHDDLWVNVEHFTLTNHHYLNQNFYPEGPEIQITSEYLSSEGRISKILIRAATDIPNVLGLAFELDFDTSLFHIDGVRMPNCPIISDIQCMWSNYNPGNYSYGFVKSPRYAFVRTNQHEFTIQQGYTLDRLWGGLELNDGVDFSEIPDTVIIRLKNLIAIDADGKDLHIGANQLVFYKDDITAISAPTDIPFSIHPNPAQDVIYVDMDGGTLIQIISVHAEILERLLVRAGSPIDISALDPGIYFIRSEESGRVGKFVKY